jgi:Putative DnaT-like ssDNA binding protein
MTIDATVGGALADSYIDVATADAFAAADYGRAASTWQGTASTDSKERVLKRATREVDAYLRSSGVVGRFNSLQTRLYPRPVDTVSALGIASSSVASPSNITTIAPHGFTSGQSVTITGHTGSTPALAGPYVITVTGARTFTIPVNVTVAGSGGSVTNPSVPTIPVLPYGIQAATYAQAKFLLSNATMLDDAQTREARGLISGAEPQVAYTLSQAAEPVLCDEALGYLQGALGGAATIHSVIIGTDYSYPVLGVDSGDLLP